MFLNVYSLNRRFKTRLSFNEECTAIFVLYFVLLLCLLVVVFYYNVFLIKKKAFFFVGFLFHSVIFRFNYNYCILQNVDYFRLLFFLLFCGVVIGNNTYYA